MADVAYFALVPWPVGKDESGTVYAEIGDLILKLTNERGGSNVREGRIAPVLVSTLPADQRKLVEDYLKAQAQPTKPESTPESEAEPAPKQRAAKTS
jgi:hypothetical protein